MLIAGLIIPVYLSIFDQKIIDFVDDTDTWLLICIFMEDVCGQDSLSKCCQVSADNAKISR